MPETPFTQAATEKLFQNQFISGTGTGTVINTIIFTFSPSKQKQLTYISTVLYVCPLYKHCAVCVSLT